MFVTNRVLIIFATILTLTNGNDFRSNTCKKLYSYRFRTVSKNCYYNPDVFSTTSNLIVRYGFRAESHKVVTADGYILTLIRVKPKSWPQGNSTKKPQPVFIQHGAFISSTSWLMLGNKSLPFKLAEQNYDVWLGNFRGAQFSREHLNKSFWEKDFWDYNIDSLAKFDLPAQLNFVKNATGSSVVYIGHSMGTTTAFMLASENPKEAAKLIKGIIALSPVVYLKGTLTKLGHLFPAIKFFLNLLQIKGLPFGERFHEKIYGTCGMLPYFCTSLLTYLMGDFTGQFAPELLLIVFRIFPDSMSIDEVAQFGQFIVSDEFKKFDYGPAKNFAVYGQRKPPMYDLTKVELPVYMFYGKNDKLNLEKNVARVFHELGSKNKTLTEVPKNMKELQFNHGNFLWSKDIEKFLYKDMFEVIKNKFK